MPKRLLLIDNYDSFTYNIVHAVGVMVVDLTIIRNDEWPVSKILNSAIDGIIISPGPCTPDTAGICLQLIQQAKHIPILGICLGMQSLVQAYGGRIIVQTPPKHGKVYQIFHQNTDILHGLSDGFMATRYHSLIAEESRIPEQLTITARCEDSTIMAVAHKRNPHYGVQFHPESIRTTEGTLIFQNFVDSIPSNGKSKPINFGKL